MNIEEFREYCIAKKGVTESFPFDEYVLVFKVMGKMFALANTENFNGFSLKCDPEWAIELRETYPDGIMGAWHMNKTHWNSVRPEEGIPPELVKELIDHSYDLIVSSLTKKLQNQLRELE